MSSRIRATCWGAVAPTTAPTSLSAHLAGRAKTRQRWLPLSPTACRRRRSRCPRGPRPRGSTCGRGRRPRPGGAGGLEQRLERVDAEVRAGGEGVRPEALDEAERGRRAADERLAVGGGRHGDVAALAVGQDDQARGAGVLDDLGQRSPSRRAQALEARELRLRRAAGGPGRVDERAAVGRHRPGRALGGRPVGGRVLQRIRPEARRIRVEPQDDLGLAPGDDLARGGPRNAVGAPRRPVRMPRRAAASARSASR